MSSSYHPSEVSLSVVIPVRDAEPYIGDMLECLSRQTISSPWEVLFVDNGSSDGSVAIAGRFSNKLHLRVITAPPEPNESKARNLGVREAAADRILFIDADDIVADDYVEVMNRALDESDFVAARVDSTSLNPGWLATVHGPPWQQESLEDWFGFLPCATPCFGVKKPVFEAAGGWPEHYPNSAQDVAFSWRVQLNGTPLRFVREATYFYRYRSSPRALYRQTRNWGKANALLYREFRSLGMPGRRIGQAARDWGRAVRLLRRVGSKEGRAAASVQFGYCVGRLQGSARYRVIYL